MMFLESDRINRQAERRLFADNLTFCRPGSHAPSRRSLEIRSWRQTSTRRSGLLDVDLRIWRVRAGIDLSGRQAQSAATGRKRPADATDRPRCGRPTLTAAEGSSTFRISPSVPARISASAISWPGAKCGSRSRQSSSAFRTFVHRAATIATRKRHSAYRTASPGSGWASIAAPSTTLAHLDRPGRQGAFHRVGIA